MRRIARRALRALVCGAIVALGFVAATPDVSAAPCSSAQKAKAVKTLAAFIRTMPAKRRAYFRAHAAVAKRRAYVERQQAVLKRLRAAARCRVKQPPLSVPPVTTAAPPPLPAPATYTFGPEVTTEQQASLRAGLDLGARFIRSSLGRELPSFPVWAYTDVEALIRAYSETAPTELENSRNIWTRGTFATAQFRKLWFGPLWFSGGPPANLTKIAVHETFHVLQYELAGDRALNSGFDDIPRAGPRWLAEGSAELVAYLAIADAGLTSLAAVRDNWVQRAKSSPVTIERLAVLRGQFEAGANAWGMMPLAVERLVGEGGAAKMVAYFEAIGRGDAWQAAFSAVFGQSADAFHAEFERYRLTL